MKPRKRSLLLLLSLIVCLIDAQQQYPPYNTNFDNNPFNQQPGQPQVPQQQPSNFNPGLNGGTLSFDAITKFHENLFLYGAAAGDAQVSDNTKLNGHTIDLQRFFPFYGGRYNYTMISSNGYISFAYFSEQGPSFKVGSGANWPAQADPAVIAPYLCRQNVAADRGNSRVWYRVEMRKQDSHFHFENPSVREPCSTRARSGHVYCDSTSSAFLDSMQRLLQDAVAGGGTMRAAAALVVTWQNVHHNLEQSRFSPSTYQLVWITDEQAQLSYTIINYDRLGYDADDVNGNTRLGRCQALFNGGNATGTVPVDASDATKLRPSSLAERSAAPHQARGRYYHRVDDVVRPAGCSNKTGGSFPLMIYPNIANMLGEMKVDVNGMCLSPTSTYVLMIDQRPTAPCDIVNPSLARCRLPRVQDWGTKTVYFQPQSGVSQDERAFLGYIYFVPPTLDPQRLDVGNIHSWFSRSVPRTMPLHWYPRNFSQTRLSSSSPGFQDQMIASGAFDDSIYAVQLGLYVVGYKEDSNEKMKKFTPRHRVIAKLASFANGFSADRRWEPRQELIDTRQVQQWYLSRDELRDELYTFRFGYFKLAPDTGALEAAGVHTAPVIETLPEGLISAPVALHWLWPLAEGAAAKKAPQTETERDELVTRRARQLCHRWFDEDGALENLVRHTETNSSCPCREAQARADLGRFMPHPRCSHLFRDITCTETLGSMNCYMSSQSVRGTEQTGRTKSGGFLKESAFGTHYGQTCCYDSAGYLMQSSYQPLIKVGEYTPYSPGFPTRAFEFGTEPYQGMFEVPGLSAFHHDIAPYYLCCKWTDARCQMFYWRRPSSACQAYRPPQTATIMGAGVISTLDGRSLVFNEPGVFTLLHAQGSQRIGLPNTVIQARFERFPDRSVDFGGVDQQQRRLVQPSNVTVLTGIAIEADGSDRVHVVMRKDTRRMRYRTTVLVNGIIHFFDNMLLQRFRGVTVYVNNVQRGQAEIYVVLEKAQIGIKLRESYAIDLDRESAYPESLGLLDLFVSVPPHYRVGADAWQFSPQDQSIPYEQRIHVDGILYPQPDAPLPVSAAHIPLQWADVNSDAYRSLLLKYLITSYSSATTVVSPVGGGGGTWWGGGEQTSDLFIVRTDDALADAFPDRQLLLPVYQAALDASGGIFHAPQEADVRALIAFCRAESGQSGADHYEDTWYGDRMRLRRRCPSDLNEIETRCGSDVACLFTALFLQARLLGDSTRSAADTTLQLQLETARHYNSCGAVSIEYPEFMVKGPEPAGPAYLDGDRLTLSCAPTHIAKGHTDFVCYQERINNQRDQVRMRWTSGAQPWCRHRVTNNLLTWLMWVSIAVAVILVVLALFFTCWMLKRKRQSERMAAANERGDGGASSVGGSAASSRTKKPLQRTDYRDAIQLEPLRMDDSASGKYSPAPPPSLINRSARSAGPVRTSVAV